MSLALLFSLVLYFCTSFAQAQNQTPALRPALGPSGFPSRGNTFNPDIGINSLFLYRNSNRGNDATVENPNGFAIQEAELQFSGDVDPYWRFVSTFSLHQEYDDSVAPPTRHYVFEPEEVFAESLDLPWVTLRAGKFKTAFGRHNTLHTHAFPFIDAPLINSTLLGQEGLNDAGISIAVLLPASWFSEVTVQGVAGRAEGIDYYNSKSADSMVGVLHLKNLWDLSDDLTFELGLSGASGENQDARTTNLFGGDLTFKWRPDGDASRAIVWATELISREQNRAAYEERGKGLASWIQYQFSRRWWLELRGEALEIKQQDPAAASPLPEYQGKQSILIGFIPSEFSGIRFQYDQLNIGDDKPEHRALVQFNYSIGAHPTHSY